MFPAIGLEKMFQQIISDVLNVVISEKVHNPYLKAALGPIVSTFSQGILDGSTSEEVGQKTYDTVQQLPAEARQGAIGKATKEDFAKLHQSFLLHSTISHARDCGSEASFASGSVSGLRATPSQTRDKSSLGFESRRASASGVLV